MLALTWCWPWPAESVECRLGNSFEVELGLDLAILFFTMCYTLYSIVLHYIYIYSAGLRLGLGGSNLAGGTRSKHLRQVPAAKAANDGGPASVSPSVKGL